MSNADVVVVGGGLEGLAVAWALGERGVRDLAPAAVDRQRVAAVLEASGLPEGDGSVFIRRVIQRGGRSRTYVNGALTTAARLAELGALLIDLSGQHQHQGLVDPSRHVVRGIAALATCAAVYGLVTLALGVPEARALVGRFRRR